VLNSATDEEGSAPVELTLAIVVLMLLSLGVIQVGLTLYARNVVISAAHEGARVAAELDRPVSDSSEAARRIVEHAAGGIVDELEVASSMIEAGDRLIARVRVSGRLNVPGPVPVSIPVRATATTSREVGFE
jgi:hypothetical protein